MPPCNQNNATVSQITLAGQPWNSVFTKICKLERAPATLHERTWMIHPCRSTRGPKTKPEKKPHSTHWLLHLQPFWDQSNIETLSMLLHRFSYVIHHDYQAVRRLLLLLVVCLSSLKCDSGVMDNCTAILTTVSSILSFSSFNNVHYYYSHKRAPTNTCHNRRTAEEAGASLEVALWRASMVEGFLHGRLCVVAHR